MTEVRKKRFLFYLIKPSHYDDDGYVIQWFRSSIPSNSLASLYGLAVDCRERAVLGDDVEIEIEAVDETNTRIRPERIAASFAERRPRPRRPRGRAVEPVSPRHGHRPFAARRGHSGLLGGFHVSGCLAMLPDMPDDMKEARSLGISFFAGEAEGRLDAVLRTPPRASCSRSIISWTTCRASKPR